MKPLLIASTLTCALACAAPGTARAGGLVQIPWRLANFSTPLTIDNRYWALVPGRHVVYYEVDGDECIVNDFFVTNGVKHFGGRYAGMSARVVRDVEWLDEDCDGGRDVMLEDTDDWYAQDNAGNIWYMGEATVEYLFDDDGEPIGTSTAGSWESGVDGAKPGLIMLARPEKGLFYRQEYYAGVAEDWGKIQAVGAEVTTGLGTFRNCVVIKEWNGLNPGSIERKTYCRNAGLVLIEGFSGGKTSATEAVDLDLP